MSRRPHERRQIAGEPRIDVDAVIQHSLDQDAVLAAQGFIEFLEQAYVHIGRRAATGSPRYAHELHLPGLRFWPLTRYPYLVFYIEQESHVDVWRLLHGRRDIPSWMQQPDQA